MLESIRAKLERRFQKDASTLYGIKVPDRMIVRFLSTAEKRYGLTLQPVVPPAKPEPEKPGDVQAVTAAPAK
jgi:hypothetical protein